MEESIICGVFYGLVSLFKVRRLEKAFHEHADNEMPSIDEDKKD